MQHNNIKPNPKPFPANLLKFDAYIKVVDSLDAAVEVVKKKRLCYGQPCVVTYIKSPDETFKRILFAVGSMNPDEPFLFGLEKDEEGHFIDQEDLIKEMERLIEEFKEKFVITSIKISTTEPINVNKDDFTYGDLILGEGAIKRVIDNVSKNSTELVTSKGIYNFINSLYESITQELNNLDTKITDLRTDVSANKVEIVKVKKDVSTLTNKVKRLEQDTSTLAHRTYVESITSDSSFITVVTVGKTVKLDVSINSIFSDDFMEGDDGKIHLAWNKYEEN